MKRNRMAAQLTLSAWCMIALTAGPVVAAEVSSGGDEVRAILDGVLQSQFRRITRVRAALLECDLPDEAAVIAPTEAEKARGEFEFSKAVLNSESASIRAFLDQIGPQDKRRGAVAAMYAVALEMYFSGVRDGASGSLIWVDDDDKKKLCAYMVREAKDFVRLRSGE